MLDHFDLFDPDQGRTKLEMLAYAREHCPVSRRKPDGPWLVTRYDDVRHVLLDPELFSSRKVTPRPSPIAMPPLDSDPPFQPALRKILNPYFTRGYLKQFEPDMRALASRLIDRFAEAAHCELMSEFVTPFTAAVLAQIVFDENDHEKVTRAVDAVIRNATENTPESFHDVARIAHEFLTSYVPGQRDNVLHGLATGTLDDGRKLTIDEQVAVVGVLFLAGLDTTRGAISLIIDQLAQHPELEERLRTPSWVRTDLDEYIRLLSPVQCLGRVATRDTTVGDVSIAAGEQILVHFGSANRDDRQYPNASTLNFSRSKAHIGFGLGIHRCLGAQLARIQIEIAIDELLRRLSGIRLAANEGLTYTAGITAGVEKLPIEFTCLPT